MTVVRRLTIRDLPILNKNFGRTIRWKRYLASRLKARKRAILVAEKGESLVGYVEMSIEERGWRIRTPLLGWARFEILPSYGSKADAALLPYRYGMVRRVSVMPEQSKAGIGHDLAQAGLEWLRRRDVDSVLTMIDAGDREGERFFSDLGFKPIQYLVGIKLAGEQIPPREEVHFAGREDLRQLSELLRQEITYQTELSQRIQANTFQLVPDLDWARFTLAKSKDKTIEILLIKREGQVVGYLEVHLIKTGNRRHGYIEDVYVLPEHRRRGFAEALLQGCLHWSQSRGVSTIRASIRAGNEASLRLFEGLGFMPVKKVLGKRV